MQEGHVAEAQMNGAGGSPPVANFPGVVAKPLEEVAVPSNIVAELPVDVAEVPTHVAVPPGVVAASPEDVASAPARVAIRTSDRHRPGSSGIQSAVLPLR